MWKRGTTYGEVRIVGAERGPEPTDEVKLQRGATTMLVNHITCHINHYNIKYNINHLPGEG